MISPRDKFLLVVLCKPCNFYMWLVLLITSKLSLVCTELCRSTVVYC